MRHLAEEPKVQNESFLKIWSKIGAQWVGRVAWGTRGLRESLRVWGCLYSVSGESTGTLTMGSGRVWTNSVCVWVCTRVCTCEVPAAGLRHPHGRLNVWIELLIYLCTGIWISTTRFHPAQQDGGIGAVFVGMIWVSDCDLCGQPCLCVYICCTCVQSVHALQPCLDTETDLQQSLLTWVLIGSHITYFLQEISSLFMYTYIPTKMFDLVQYVICMECKWNNFLFWGKKKCQSNTFLFFCLRKSLGVLIPLIIFITLLKLEICAVRQVLEISPVVCRVSIFVLH